MRLGQQEEWLKEYYELEIELEDSSELEIAKANALGTINVWLSPIPGCRKNN